MTGELSVDSGVGRLRGDLRTVADAHRLPNAGGLPESPGLYAWWMVPGVIHGVTGPSHPAQPFELLYVGIAPKDGQSRATLRSRIRGQHLGGNIGSSTFRQSLAALLFEAMGWTTRWSGTRAQLSPEDNGALSDWQREHLRLAWVERPRPWTIEAQVIALMQPSLNLADNASRPLYHRLRKASLHAPELCGGDPRGSYRERSWPRSLDESYERRCRDISPNLASGPGSRPSEPAGDG